VADSKRVYNKLKPLIIDGAEKLNIYPFDKLSDGRAVVTILKRYAEVETSKKIRMVVAYPIINTVRYTGPTRNFTLVDYIK